MKRFVSKTKEDIIIEAWGEDRDCYTNGNNCSYKNQVWSNNRCSS